MPTFKWYFDLRENTITQDVKEDYVAIPRKMLSLTSKDLAKWIAEERTEYRIDTIENIINIYYCCPIKDDGAKISDSAAVFTAFKSYF